MLACPSTRLMVYISAVTVAASIGFGATPAAASASYQPITRALHAHAAHTSSRRGAPTVRGSGCSRVVVKRFGAKKAAMAGFCGRRMSPLEMVVVLRRAGWSWPEMPAALSTFIAESDGYVLAWHANRAPNGRLLSTDRSWTQINDRYHPGILKVNYADPVVAARFAHDLARRYGLQIWMGYGHRAGHLKAANAAIKAAKAHGLR